MLMPPGIPGMRAPTSVGPGIRPPHTGGVRGMGSGAGSAGCGAVGSGEGAVVAVPEVGAATGALATLGSGSGTSIGDTATGFGAGAAFGACAIFRVGAVFRAWTGSAVPSRAGACGAAFSSPASSSGDAVGAGRAASASARWRSRSSLASALGFEREQAATAATSETMTTADGVRMGPLPSVRRERWYHRSGRKVRRSWLVLAVAALAACGGTPRHAPGPDPALADTLKRLIQNAYDFSRPDPVERMSALYPDSGRVISASGGEIITTADSVRSGIREFWTYTGKNMRDAHWQWDSVYADRLGPDAAVLTGTWSIPHIAPNNQPHVIRGAWTAVFRRIGGQWKIVQEHLSRSE